MNMITVLEWFVKDTTVAGVTWVGSILGGFGLAATYLQARAARTAAEEASIAVQSLRGRINIGNLAYSYSQIEIVRSLVQSGNLPMAQAIFHSLKRMILEACSSMSTEVILGGQIEMVNRNIGVIEFHIDLGIEGAERYDRAIVMKALFAIGTFLVNREQDLKYAPRE